jgi:hypothetical protein
MKMFIEWRNSLARSLEIKVSLCRCVQERRDEDGEVRAVENKVHHRRTLLLSSFLIKTMCCVCENYFGRKVEMRKVLFNSLALGLVSKL